MFSKTCEEEISRVLQAGSAGFAPKNLVVVSGLMNDSQRDVDVLGKVGPNPIKNAVSGSGRPAEAVVSSDEKNAESAVLSGW